MNPLFIPLFVPLMMWAVADGTITPKNQPMAPSKIEQPIYYLSTSPGEDERWSREGELEKRKAYEREYGPEKIKSSKGKHPSNRTPKKTKRK